MIFQGKLNVLGFNIAVCDYDYLLNQILKTRKKTIYAPIATHPIMLGQENPSLRSMYNSIDYLLPDSQYIRHALFFLHRVRMKDRVYGPELFSRICHLSQRKGLCLFICGNDTKKIKNRLEQQYPKLKIVGQYDLRLKSEESVDPRKIDQSIIKSGANIVLIGIGSPSQHLLATKLSSKKAIVCVGAAFDFILNKQRKSPPALGRIGLEWFYRFINNPLKMWFRYLVLAPLFFLGVIKQKITNE